MVKVTETEDPDTHNDGRIENEHSEKKEKLENEVCVKKQKECAPVGGYRASRLEDGKEEETGAASGRAPTRNCLSPTTTGGEGRKRTNRSRRRVCEALGSVGSLFLKNRLVELSSFTSRCYTVSLVLFFVFSL
ncbi:Protein CBG25224 [Caenorhabditis briggsae]|uniref:Protein CBG25224 n=1 Tax=Caenorhabditis briggsae TaxID=6238 RepID=B6IFJ4_CAEBR|nr:Protein CBG25224 [Caenorhabditis briggsae]CAR98674.1 Protein CBG25224 [Caenorhabditis briggsae]